MKNQLDGTVESNIKQSTFNEAQRIVIKVGSRLLIEADGTINSHAIQLLIEEIHKYHSHHKSHTHYYTQDIQKYLYTDQQLTIVLEMDHVIEINHCENYRQCGIV